MIVGEKELWRWVVWGYRNLTSMLEELDSSGTSPASDVLGILEEHVARLETVAKRQRRIAREGLARTETEAAE